MRNILLRFEDLKQEREAVVDCVMKLESAFLTATNEKKVVMIWIKHACWQIHQEAVTAKIRSSG